jgi:hypothetical protein
MASRSALRSGLPSSGSTRVTSRRLLAVAGVTAGVFVTSMASAYAAAPHVLGDVEPASSAPQLMVRQGSAVEGLYPGAKAALAMTVTNLGQRQVAATSVVATDTVVTGSAGGCDARDFSLNVAVPAPTMIPAGGSRQLVLPGAIAMREAAGDGCQGATVTVRVHVTAGTGGATHR